MKIPCKAVVPLFDSHSDCLTPHRSCYHGWNIAE